MAILILIDEIGTKSVWMFSLMFYDYLCFSFFSSFFDFISFLYLQDSYIYYSMCFATLALSFVFCAIYSFQAFSIYPVYQPLTPVATPPSASQASSVAVRLHHSPTTFTSMDHCTACFRIPCVAPLDVLSLCFPQVSVLYVIKALFCDSFGSLCSLHSGSYPTSDPHNLSAFVALVDLGFFLK